MRSLAYAGINNACRSLLQEDPRKPLRGGIAVRRQAFAKSRSLPNVMELCPKIGEVLDIFGDLRMWPVDFLKLSRDETLLPLARFQVERRHTMLRDLAIEPTASGMSNVNAAFAMWA